MGDSCAGRRSIGCPALPDKPRIGCGARRGVGLPDDGHLERGQRACGARQALAGGALGYRETLGFRLETGTDRDARFDRSVLSTGPELPVASPTSETVVGCRSAGRGRAAIVDVAYVSPRFCTPPSRPSSRQGAGKLAEPVNALLCADRRAAHGWDRRSLRTFLARPATRRRLLRAPGTPRRRARAPQRPGMAHARPAPGDRARRAPHRPARHALRRASRATGQPGGPRRPAPLGKTPRRARRRHARGASPRRGRAQQPRATLLLRRAPRSSPATLLRRRRTRGGDQRGRPASGARSPTNGRERRADASPRAPARRDLYILRVAGLMSAFPSSRRVHACQRPASVASPPRSRARAGVPAPRRPPVVQAAQIPLIPSRRMITSTALWPTWMPRPWINSALTRVAP